MKKIILLITLMFSISSFADCINEYNKFVKKSFVKSTLSTTATPFAGYAGFAAFIIGGWGGSAPVLVSGMITTTGTVIMAGKGVSHFSNAISINFAKKILQEAQVGMGRNISNMAEELTEELNIFVDEEMVSDIINEGNSRSKFCNSVFKKPYNTKEIYLYVKNHL